jgi:hypothetical protein
VSGVFNTTAPTQTAVVTPFIPVDGTQVVIITPGEQPSDILKDLNTSKTGVSLALGLISQLLVEQSSTTPSGGSVLAPLSAPTFLADIAPDVPQNLLLTLEPQYLLGAHVYDGNQAFLIMSVGSYEQAFSAMLAWEPTMQTDLAPLFTYTPNTLVSGNSGSASSTSASSTLAGQAPQFLQTGFVDDIVENHDARVVKDSSGNILLLWTFLDRNTIVITTNDATLREIISRLQTAPVTSAPTQQ